MILAWAVWPLIIVFAVLGVALRRLLYFWWIPILLGVVAFVASFIALIVMTYVGPDKPVADTDINDLLLAVRWWHRLGYLGITRLLPDHWTVVHYDIVGRPETVSPVDAYLMVAFGTSLTVAAAVAVAVFVLCLVRSIDRTTAPFPGGVQ